MNKRKLMLSLFFIPMAFITACAQDVPTKDMDLKTAEEIQVLKKENASIHPYGGWYCPDNLGGFPPVDVYDLAKVPVVNGRMPTKEETQNGTSLMYFDPSEFPTATPMEISLPKLARYYSQNTEQNELVIIIQAVVVDQDTVVGFRYLNGGNGTSWYNEVDILSAKEVSELGSTPFVFLESKINAPKEKVWEAIANTEYAKNLGIYFDKEAFFESPWTKESRVKLQHHEMVGEVANGIIMTLFGNIYLQIDYNRLGHQSVEKILIMDNEDGKTSTIQLVFGPYAEAYKSEQAYWEEWLEEVQNASSRE